MSTMGDEQQPAEHSLFVRALTARIEQATLSLLNAALAGDDVQVQVSEAELADLCHLAARHDVQIAAFPSTRWPGAGAA